VGGLILHALRINTISPSRLISKLSFSTSFHFMFCIQFFFEVQLGIFTLEQLVSYMQVSQFMWQSFDLVKLTNCVMFTSL